MDRNEVADLLTETVHRYFDRVAGPLLLVYLFVVPFAVTQFTPMTVDDLRTLRGMASVVVGPPILLNCLVMYGWLVADLLRDTDVHLYRADVEK
ncbi:hypothetical protein [Halomontanus rarus]|uniref:hypothetical protein n=1 Tax=Halomontanus rarus TaxID=3034020 RepID=UPI001A9A17A0